MTKFTNFCVGMCIVCLMAACTNSTNEPAVATPTAAAVTVTARVTATALPTQLPTATTVPATATVPAPTPTPVATVTSRPVVATNCLSGTWEVSGESLSQSIMATLAKQENGPNPQDLGMTLAASQGGVRYVFGADGAMSNRADFTARYSAVLGFLTATVDVSIKGSSTGSYTFTATELVVNTPGAFDVVAELSIPVAELPPQKVPAGGKTGYTCSADTLVLSRVGPIENLRFKKISSAAKQP
jgi:hypothetical protein